MSDPRLVPTVRSVVLGPGLNVQRVALNGRNAEYLSGEEPSLGVHLATAYVRGVQSEGVAAVAKHYVGNNQETDRTSTGAWRAAESCATCVMYHRCVGRSTLQSMSRAVVKCCSLVSAP